MRSRDRWSYMNRLVDRSSKSVETLPLYRVVEEQEEIEMSLPVYIEVDDCACPWREGNKCQEMEYESVRVIGGGGM